jgi:hypothetical protein
MKQRANPSGNQGGATAVEMALVMLFVVQLMFGIVDFSRWLFAMNSAAEATRYGARLAAVCDQNASGIRTKMAKFLPVQNSAYTATQIPISYLQGPCGSGEICAVSVSLNNVGIQPISWFIVSPTMPLPALRTILPRESLSSATNADCT